MIRIANLELHSIVKINCNPRYDERSNDSLSWIFVNI